jgi:hypothetical protein
VAVFLAVRTSTASTVAVLKRHGCLRRSVRAHAHTNMCYFLNKPQ